MPTALCTTSVYATEKSPPEATYARQMRPEMNTATTSVTPKMYPTMAPMPTRLPARRHRNDTHVHSDAAISVATPYRLP
jgi:hypothetical protein